MMKRTLEEYEGKRDWLISGVFEDACSDIATLSTALESKERLIAELVEAHAWQPIDTCPFRVTVDLWCVYGGEEFAQYDGGAAIGKLVAGRNKSEEYGFFGNQSNDGVPNRDGLDLKPVAWRKPLPGCPSELIAKVMDIPLTRDAALSKAKGEA